MGVIPREGPRSASIGAVGSEQVRRRDWVWLAFALVVVGGAWLLVWRLDAARWSSGLWQFRDDGIITLSHARGLLDTGSVGVSASGARVNGFSTPLQFLLFIAASPLFGHDYQGFIRLQTLLGTTVLAGLLLVLLWRTGARYRAFNVGLGVVGSWITLSSFRFFGWQSSGMENAITNAIALLVIATMAWSLSRERPSLAAEMTVGVLTIGLSLARTEFIFHAAPLVVAYAALHYRRFRVPRRAVVAPLILAAGWSGAAAIQYLYFGSLRPNTGYVEAIDPIANLQRLAAPTTLALLGAGIAVLYAMRSRRLDRPADRRRRTVWLIGLGSVVVSVGAALVQYGMPDAIPGFTVVAHTYARFSLLPLMIPTAVLYRYTESRSRPVLQLLGVMLLSGSAAPLLFGAVRWDATRPMSFMLPIAVAALLISIRDAAAHLWQHTARRSLSVLAGVAAVGPALVLGWAVSGPWNHAIPLCCNAAPVAHQITVVADQLSRQQGIPDPIVANPDLGALSFAKRFNIVDLGWIGDPVLAHIDRNWSAAREAWYLTDVAAPDVVELHQAFSCIYNRWIDSPEFQAQYQLVQSSGTTVCPNARQRSLEGIWQRNTSHPNATTNHEYAFVRTLAAHPSPETIQREIGRCATAASTDPTRCLYVTRAADRLLPVLRQHHDLNTLAAAFQNSPSYSYDKAILKAPTTGRWYQTALAALTKIANHLPAQ